MSSTTSNEGNAMSIDFTDLTSPEPTVAPTPAEPVRSADDGYMGPGV